MTPTPLDAAMARADGDAADGGVVDALLNAELLLLLEAPADGGRIRPRVLELEAGPTALAFDTEMRLAEFAAGEDYVALPGRTLAEMLGAQGLNLAVNPGVAPSELFHAADALVWMTQAAAAELEGAETRLSEFAPPRLASEGLVAALDAKLAGLAARLEEAWLVEGREADGARRLLMILREAAPPAQGPRPLAAAAEAGRAALARAVAETARLADPEGPGLDAMFSDENAPALHAARRFGLRFDLPKAAARPAAAGPGMDPAKPPILR